MEYYDGPAFYRKYFNGAKPFQTQPFAKKQSIYSAKAQNQEQIPKTGQQGETKLPRYYRKFRLNSRAIASPPNNQYQNSGAETAVLSAKAPVKKENHLLELTQQFHPGKTKKDGESFYSLGQKPSLQYVWALKEIEKDDDDYILMGQAPKIVHPGDVEAQDLFSFDPERPDLAPEYEVVKKRHTRKKPRKRSDKSRQKREKIAEARVNQALGNSLDGLFGEENDLADDLSYFKPPEDKEDIPKDEQNRNND